MKLPLFIILCIFCCSGTLYAQDSSRQARRSFDSSLLADNNTLTPSDYLASLERTFQAFNKVPVVVASFSDINEITDYLDEDDSALSIIKERLSQSDRTLNLRNLQMFSSLLEQLASDTKDYNKQLDKYDASLEAIKKEIRDQRKDTVIRSIFRDSALRASFRPQLQQLRIKWKNADSLIRLNTTLINNLKAHSSANVIAIQELQYQSDTELKAIGTKAFSKERKYLWEPRASKTERSFSKGWKKSLSGEKDIAKYYFSNTRNQRYLLFITGLLFFFWVFYNFRIMRRMNKMGALEQLHLSYIHPIPLISSLVFMLNLAPLFDLNAPAIYIESIGFFLMLALTIFFWKRLPRKLFFFWGIFILLFLSLSFGRLLGMPVSLQRYWTLAVNSGAIVLGIFVLFACKKYWRKQKIVGMATGLYILLNLLAIICNLAGRVTLTNIFGSTAIYAVAQIAGLIIFIQLVTEAFLLQIQSSRIKKQYPEDFDSVTIAKGIKRFVSLLALLIWLIVFTTNLNVYNSITTKLAQFLTTPRTLGSFSFTLSGIILFLGIIWAANFLQKYIAFFWGDIGDDAAFDNKGQRSKLLITRLILLIAGFLVAVAASGLPIDKITVILGALGVGIGLGLQSIVNNFVSGIILIFDRPLRIGDIVEIGDKKGRVKEIGVRSSTLLTADGAEVIIPNGDVLSHNIVNWTLSNNHIRMDISFKIEKPVDAEAIRTIIKETMKSSPVILPGKDPEILINNVNTSTAEIKIYFWCKDVSKTEYARSDIFDAIQNRFEEKGIKII